MCTLCQALEPTSTDTDTHAGGNLTDGGGKPTYSNDQVADYLTTGFWNATGRDTRSFDVETGGTITYNINRLDALGKEAALDAMESWTAVSGLQFEAASDAMMTFDDNQTGAYNSSVTSGNTIISSSINVHTTWRQYGDYYLQTYIHEIGHAIGLGHTGDYNGSASYNSDAHFANDSWQVSVMSYFDQNQNTAIDASRIYLATAQMADIVAVQNLYGTATTVRTSDTVYGDSHNTGQSSMDLDGRYAVAIVDNGGTDHIDLGSRNYHQTLNLNAETYSNINGYTGNFSIARGTVIENATTGIGDDLVTGNGADNRISTGAGDDTIFGNGGNDILIGGTGADLLTGGSGADRFTYETLSDGGDTITDFALSQGDRIDITDVLIAAGYSGDDPVGDGAVSLQNDAQGAWLVVDNNGAVVQIALLIGISHSASVADIIAVDDLPDDPDPSGGNDTLYRFTDAFADGWTDARGLLEDVDGGTDTIDISGVTVRSRIYLDSSKVGKLAGKKFLIDAETTIENLILGTNADIGVGNGADNSIDGMDGADKLYGLAGNDTITGGEGKDRLYGGDGNDILDGGEDANRVYGDAGDDIITTGAGKDRIYAGAGNDTADGGAGDDYFWGHDGDDELTGGAGRDRLKGGSGNDTLYGGDDADRIEGEDGDDVIDGAEGNDTLEGDDGNDQVYGGAGIDRLRGNDGDDILEAGSGNDRAYGDKGNDIVRGDGGADKLYGGHGNDTVEGGEDNDKLYGDKGDDMLFGGAGNDSLYGGTENDVLFGGDGNDMMLAHAGNDELDGGLGDDRLDGDRGNDSLYGGDGNDELDAGADNDILDGAAGDDELDGGSGDDQLDGGSGNDELDAGSGDDHLDGGSGDDELDGGTGNDRLIGGLGIDELTGGSGNDVFVFTSLAEAGDEIRDFNLRFDKIEVSGLLADLGTTVADAIADGVLIMGALGRDALIQIDADGAGEGAAVDLVELNRIDTDTVLDESWLI